jgi:hypothetical protein
LIICDACGRPAEILDKFLRPDGYPYGWMSISQGEAAFSWHVCSWTCLTDFGAGKQAGAAENFTIGGEPSGDPSVQKLRSPYPNQFDTIGMPGDPLPKKKEHLPPPAQ